MVVIPITGAGLWILLFLIPGFTGFLATLIKWAVGLFVAYLVVGCTIGWFVEGRRLKKEAQKH